MEAILSSVYIPRDRSLGAGVTLRLAVSDVDLVLCSGILLLMWLKHCG